MNRIKRVEALIKEEIASILHKKIHNTRIGFVSIIDIKISKDLSHARVFYSQIGTEDEKEETFKNLKKAAKFIKGEVGKVIRVKTIPNLRFIPSDSLEKGSELVRKINALNTPSSS